MELEMVMVDIEEVMSSINTTLSHFKSAIETNFGNKVSDVTVVLTHQLSLDQYDLMREELKKFGFSDYSYDTIVHNKRIHFIYNHVTGLTFRVELCDKETIRQRRIKELEKELEELKNETL